MKINKWTFIAILFCFSSQLINGQKYQFMFDDSLRSYVVYEPDLDPNPDGYPLIIGLHGAGAEGGLSFLGTTFMIPKAKKEKFVVACPDALLFNIVTWWNGGGLYEEITDSTDDVGFISAVIDTMIKNYNVDTTRIYVMGFSNGSAMAYRVVSELSSRIAAMGVSSGQMLYEYCNPEFPVPIIHFHGISDDMFPYYGKGDGPNAVPPVDTTIAIWRGINSCNVIPDTIYSDSLIVGKKWTSSTGLSDVILYTNQEGEHKWPRPDNWGISATDIIWDFLKMHTRGNQPDIKAGFLKYNDENRNYLVYDPFPGSGTRPLVVGLHCHTGTALGLLSYTDWIEKAKEENFIGVFPNSLFHPLVGTAWNVGSSFEEFTRGTDDVGFISAVIDEVINDYDIDTTRIYATGHSNGSMFSYRLAAELSHRIAAIGCVAAPMLYEFANPEFSVPIIHFHGLSDTTMPYEGKVEKFCDYPHMDSTLATWREINACSEIPEILMEENGVHGKKWPSSDGKGDIVLYTIDSCMHDWPVFDKYGISATDAIWDYFELHTRGIETAIDALDKHSLAEQFKLYQNYPNPFGCSTQILYILNQSGDISLKIYNLAGQEIEILVNEFQPAGEHKIIWQPKGLPGGLYFYKIEVGEFSETKKLILQTF